MKKQNLTLATVLTAVFFSLPFGKGGDGLLAQNQKLSSADNQVIVKKMKADGASEEQMKMFLQNQSGISSLKTNPVVMNVSCADGFENGWSNWQGYVGNTNGTLNPTWTSSVIITPNHAIVSASYSDTCALPSNPIPFPAPFFGDSSARMGDPQVVGCVTERLSYSFVVNPIDTSFLFTYATIIQDAGHPLADQPFFHIMLLDQNGDTIPNSYYYYIGGPNPPGFYAANCGFSTWYKPWTLRGISLSPYIGQTVTLVATNADCNYCGHFAHSYIDFDCDGILLSPRYCPGGLVTLNATSEPGSQYLWEDGSTTETVTINTPVAGDTISCWITPWQDYTFKANWLLTPAQSSFSSTVNSNTVNFTNNSPGAVSCFWDFGDGNTSTNCNPTHVYASVGTYTVCLTVQTDGCSGVTNCSTVTILSIGINEHISSADVNLVPNPASDFVMLEFSNSFAPNKISVELYNLVGAKINSFLLVGISNPDKRGKYLLNVSDLPDGIYFAKITSNNTAVTKKLAVMRSR